MAPAVSAPQISHLPGQVIDPAQAALIEAANRIREEQARRRAAAAQAQQGQGAFGGALAQQAMDWALGGGEAAATDAVTGAVASQAASQAPGAVATGIGGETLGAASAGAPYGTIINPATGEAIGTMGPGAGGAELAATGASPAAMAIGGALALHGGYKSWRNFGHGDWKGGARSGAEMGAGIGTMVAPGVGTAIGAGIGALGGGLIGKIKAGKHEDQIKRDEVRKRLQANGFLDERFNMTLADGTKFDIGRDGGAQLINKDGTTRPMYNTDASDPLTGQAVAWANPIAWLISNGDKKAFNDFAGYFANAAQSNATDINGIKANLQAFYDQIGLPREAYIQMIDEQLAAGKIDQQTADVFKHDLGNFTFKSAAEGDMDSAVNGSSRSFDAALNASMKAQRDAAAAAQKDAKKQQLISMAMNMPSPPQIRSSPVRTGVQQLDSILSGVLG